MAHKSTTVRFISAGFRALSAVAPGLAAGGALRLFRTPRRFRRPPREEAWIAAARRFELRAGARRLAAWSWGEGPAVLLVHGWEGRGAQLGAFAAPLAAAGFRAVAFDGPGHGLSEGRLSSLPEFADAVLAAAEAAGPVAGVVAHSFGTAATGRALDLGMAVERLVFLSPPADLEDYVRQFGRVLSLPDGVRRRMVRRLEQRFEVRWDEVRRPTLTAARNAPLLVIHDTDDLETPHADGVAVAAAWPRGELFTTAGLGHRRILRDGEVVERAVSFLTEGARAVAGERPRIARV